MDRSLGLLPREEVELLGRVEEEVWTALYHNAKKPQCRIVLPVRWFFILRFDKSHSFFLYDVFFLFIEGFYERTYFNGLCLLRVSMKWLVCLCVCVVCVCVCLSVCVCVSRSIMHQINPKSLFGTEV